mmetsp:Transcript_9103/g.38264  ORF Transcript_9103/g.38264 Transcript_9103/m.38264 type:complete len:343 (+) Transcript_9103:4119-5147(+)
MRLPSLYDSDRRFTRSNHAPCTRIVAVSRCLLWSGLLWMTPTPRVSSPFSFKNSFTLFANSWPMHVSSAMSMSDECFPRSLSLTHPPATRSVTGKSYALTTSSNVSKMRRSSAVHTTFASGNIVTTTRRCNSTEPSSEMSHARFEIRESRRIADSVAASLFNPPEPPDSSSPANSSRARASRGPSAAETGAAADARLAEERARAEISVCRLGSATGVPLATRAETLGLASACACLPPRSATNARLDAALHASRPLFCRDGALASSPSRVRRPARSRRTALVAVTGIHRGRRLRRDAPGVRSRVTLRPNLSAARPAVPPGRLLVTWTREELPQRRKRRDGRRF